MEQAQMEQAASPGRASASAQVCRLGSFTRQLTLTLAHKRAPGSDAAFNAWRLIMF